jgi:dienelactone hydrolase
MPQLHITPTVSLVDEPLEIRISGAAPGAQLTLQARLPSKGLVSQAVFQADETGTIDLGRQAPLSGSYDWVDPMGLVWTMKPEVQQERPPRMAYDLEPFELVFTLLQDGQLLQTETVTRRWLAEGVKRQELHDGDLRGVCFYPPGEGPLPAVIIVSGSGGGISETRAALFVNHGYVALTLGYFAYQDRPKYLTNINLEYFEQAAAWLRDQDVVDENRLVITGGSRGGELSLLLGATFPIFKAVVANVPSSQVWGGIGGEDGHTKPAWLYKSKPLYYYLPKAREEAYSQPREPQETPIPLTPMFLESMQDEEFIKASTIPVEKTQAPILLISGEDDQMWPSSLFSERVMARLKAQGFTYPYEHHSYPGAGHMIVGGYMPLAPNHGIHPVDGNDYAYGGKPRDQAFANADSWRQILRFLEENL